jgi:hypothetical protein
MKRLAFTFALFSSIAAAAAPPTQIEAQYIVINSGLTIGRASETFSRKGDTYTISSVTRSEGLLKAFVDDQFTVESTGRVGAAGLQPLEYNERRAKDNKRDLKSTFDWGKGVMRTIMRGEPSEVSLPTATQDRISIMYQFAHIRDFGDTLVIPMADRRKIMPFTYKLIEEGKITTPAGEFDTRHYRRMVDDPKETKVDLWLAKDRHNFPVRVIFDDPKGFKLEQSLVALEAR